MVESPEDYQWSSYRNRVGAIRDDVVDIDPAYTALAETGERRSACYRRFVEGSITPGEHQLIREALQRGQLTGTQRFVDEVETIIGRRIEHRGPGRPQKERPCGK